MASSNAIKAKVLHSDKSGTIGIFRYLAIKIKAIRAETRFGSKSATDRLNSKHTVLEQNLRQS